MERRVLHPFMEWANGRLAEPRYVAETLKRLRECIAADRPTMLLGGLVQLHAVARQVSSTAGGVSANEDLTPLPPSPGLEQHSPGEGGVGEVVSKPDSRTLCLPPGSRVATGGGMKEQYPFTPAQIRADLAAAFGGAPVSDVYGMAEANWAAFECAAGNHHIPPWVYPVVTDDNDCIVNDPDATGLLAFFDPIGGGDLIPPFFQTADRVRLVNPAAEDGRGGDPMLVCPCGYDSPYIHGGIQRVDLVEEAGCGAQV
jgi:hypothetical protein